MSAIQTFCAGSRDELSELRAAEERDSGTDPRSYSLLGPETVDRADPGTTHIDARHLRGIKRRAERTEGPEALVNATDGLRKKDIMTAIEAFVTRHQVRTYFALAFAVSWAGVLFVVGPAGIPTTIEHLMTIGPAMYVAMLAGPSMAGLLMTSLVSGRAGLREVLARLLTWRVGGRWYAVALLTAPFLMMAVSLALSLLSPEFLPAVFMTNDKAPLLRSGLAAGLVVGIFEELGWTGFAIPRMRRRYGVLSTGLLVGVLWGAWHFIMFWEPGSFSGTFPLALLLVKLFSWLPAYRVLMVWIYDRTGSLLVAMLMHGSLTATQLILMPLPASGMSLLTSILAWAAALWIVVAVIAVANGGQFARPVLWRRAA